MSIQSEINRIKSNMSDALAATAEMGANVPSTANSDDLGTLIRSIPKGGEGDFYVNFVDTESLDPEYTMVLGDKTYEEVMVALVEGRTVYAKYTMEDGAVFVLPLMAVEDGGVVFLIYTGSESMTIMMGYGLENYGVVEIFNDTVDLETFWQHAEDTDNPHGVTAAQVGAPTVEEMQKYVADNSGIPIVDAISSDGVTYTATVPNVTALYKGLKIIIVPNHTSTHTKPTLNVNGLGAKSLFSKVSTKTSGYTQFVNENFLSSDTPVEVIYSGSHWKVDITRPVASTMYGEVSVANGGTGRATLTSGYYLVGNGTSAVTLRSKSQVLSDIGAASASTVSSLLARIEELTERVEALEAGGGGGGGTITFYYYDGDAKYTLTADAGMTWEEFIDSDYNKRFECSCCAYNCRLFALYEEVSAGDSGDGEVVGFSYGTCPDCVYCEDSDIPLWVCYEFELEDGAGDVHIVALDEAIESGRTYVSYSTLI